MLYSNEAARSAPATAMRVGGSSSHVVMIMVVVMMMVVRTYRSWTASLRLAPATHSLQHPPSFCDLETHPVRSCGLTTPCRGRGGRDVDDGAASRRWQDRWMAGRQKTFSLPILPRNATVRQLLPTKLSHHLPRTEHCVLRNDHIQLVSLALD